MKPKNIYTLGDYYDDHLNDICHSVKNGVGMDVMAKLLCNTFKDSIPKNSILLPLPARQTFPTIVARYLCEARPDLVYQIMFGDNGLSQFYYIKQRILKDRRIILNDSNLVRIGWRSYSNNDNIILIDNVIGTGCTMAKAMRLIHKQCDALCIAVDWKTFNSYNFDE